MTWYPGPRPRSWLEDPPRRAKLESCARRQLSDLRYRHRQTRGGPVDIWRAQVRPGSYQPRLVTVEFARRFPRSPRLFVDGPTSSPHRYGDRGRTHLCLWFPDDLRDRRWNVVDGLLGLFGLAAHHLFKEAWWRETGEWLGEEAPHSSFPATRMKLNRSAQPVPERATCRVRRT